MKTITKLTLTALVCALQSAHAGDITGKVTLKGTPPAEKEITPLKEDATCGKLQASTPMTHFYVVGAAGELADAIVVLKGVEGKSTGAAASPFVLDQKNCLYSPQILAVQTGQKITARNSDSVMHNVHMVPTVLGNNEDNKGQMAGAPDLSFAFAKQENFIKFKCDVHPWMFAWVTVVDSPYFAVTGKDGSFTIKDVPPGKYKIAAMHRKAAPAGVEQEIEVKADGAKADFTIEIK